MMKYDKKVLGICFGCKTYFGKRRLIIAVWMYSRIPLC